MIPGASLSLNINQQFAKLGLDFDKAKLEIRQPKAALEIQQRPAQMEIDQGLGKLEVDGEEAHAALGRKSTTRMIYDLADQVNQLVLETIGDISAEGDQLAAIEKGTTIADIALQRQDMGPMPITDYGHPSSVHVTYLPHPLQISWIQGSVDIKATVNPPQIRYTLGDVHPYIAQKNWLSIDVKGTYLNITF